MTSEFQRLIGRAFADKTFRDDLLADPKATLKSADFNLGRQERQKLVVDMKSFQGNTAALKLNYSFNDELLFW